MEEVFHRLEGDWELPEQLNNPFCYEPHPLCVDAARRVCKHLQESPLKTEVDEGKMLGVLVCLSGEGELGFLAAYSGQLGGRADWTWFVPAVFDYLQPDGYFKQEEARISAINKRIDEGGTTDEEVTSLRSKAEQEINDYKQLMREAKARRDALRGQGHDDELVRESQYQKAELRRLKQRWAERIAKAEEPLKAATQTQEALKSERRQRSEALQGWLFDRFVMLNSKGEGRTLTEIFRHTPQQVPPSGAGECCAPKLLQYAFQHGLRPLAIAEFWQGRSPKMEVRHHGHFYPACRGKCKPILEWMLGPWEECSCGEESRWKDYALAILYEEEGLFVVVDKPSGLLSVPGLTGEESVESLLQRDHPEVMIVHRLDQDTSGLMVVALNKEAYHHLQQQFYARTIFKQYIALVEPTASLTGRATRGTISLPLRPDIADRPRQMVDFEHGKEAVTDYEIVGREDDYVCIALTPHTGRTHQLRMHCAHELGLGAPIIGDRLYGKPDQRLCLHAAELAFDHPLTGERLHFSSKPAF